MRKFLPVLIVAFVVFAISVLVSPKYVSANHRSAVLGDSTSSSELVFPQISSGPGFFLPNSNLYFLDTLFQTVRLTFALSPEKRAVVHSQIAGERLAELRIMLAQNDANGITTALAQLTSEAAESALNLTAASARGRDVREVARRLNETIKEQRNILGILTSQANGTLKLQLKASREALQEAKIEIEDELTEGEIENEIEDELEEDIKDAVDETEDTTRGLAHAIEILEKLASEAAVRNQPKRVEALEHAIEVKNEALQRQKERFITQQQSAARDAREALEDAKAALKRLSESAEESRKIEAELESENTETND